MDAKHRATLALALALSMAACGNDTDSTTTSATNGPAPAEMCSPGVQPALAAYDLDSAAFKWAACTPNVARHHVLEATDEGVYLQVAGESLPTTLPTGPNCPTEARQSPTPPESTGSSQGPVIDGVRIDGGQDDPTTAYDNTTGAVLWTQPGSPAYDDVWAVGDGAVYVVNRRVTSGLPQLVAYDLNSGIALGDREDIPDELWPWCMDGGVLFALWNNLAMISTNNRNTIW